MKRDNEIEQIFVDGVQSIGTHNGIVRIQFFTLNPDGEAKVTAALLVPQAQLRGIIEGLSRSVR